ncbi:hypothetical protein NIES2107_57590 [Nostoc carneum NIES-2107]|nr:hypothetical protein NIES2107_57590 [Nostoc carneum NIES-2107]
MELSENTALFPTLRRESDKVKPSVIIKTMMRSPANLEKAANQISTFLYPKPICVICGFQIPPQQITYLFTIAL